MLNKFILPIFLLCAILISGCSSSNPGIQYDFMEPNVSIKNDAGYLKIYTFNFEEKKGFNGDEAIYNVYKGYSIYTKNGDHVMDIDKSVGEPELVKLKQGDYI